jgi:hypothetical protein
MMMGVAARELLRRRPPQMTTIGVDEAGLCFYTISFDAQMGRRRAHADAEADADADTEAGAGAGAGAEDPATGTTRSLDREGSHARLPREAATERRGTEDPPTRTTRSRDQGRIHIGLPRETAMERKVTPELRPWRAS